MFQKQHLEVDNWAVSLLIVCITACKLEVVGVFSTVLRWRDSPVTPVSDFEMLCNRCQPERFFRYWCFKVLWRLFP